MKDEHNIMIGKQLKNLRLLSGCSQQKAANKLKVTVAKWQAYEDGEERISIRTMLAASLYFNSVCMTLLIIPTIFIPSHLKDQARLVKRRFKESI